MRALWMAGALSALALCSLACRTTAPGAKVKYGYLDDEVVNGNALIKLQPGSRIKVCGPLGPAAAFVLQQWERAAGRTFPIAAAGDCNQEPGAKLVVTITDPTGADLDYCHGALGGGGAGAFADNKDPAMTRLISCPGNWPTDAKVYAMLYHEIGHFWGMCDQYSVNQATNTFADFVGMNPNCTGTYRSVNATNSAMNAAGFNDKVDGLMPDDVLGARILACRADVPANQVWAGAEPQLYASFRDDPAFASEVERLAAQGAQFLPVCRQQVAHNHVCGCQPFVLSLVAGGQQKRCRLFVDQEPSAITLQPIPSDQPCSADFCGNHPDLASAITTVCGGNLAFSEPAPTGNGGTGIIGPYDGQTVTLHGAGKQSAAFATAQIARSVFVNFKPGCTGPFTGNLIVNSFTQVPCANCSDPTASTYGPWLFDMAGPTSISTVGGDLGDGSCSYTAGAYQTLLQGSGKVTATLQQPTSATRVDINFRQGCENGWTGALTVNGVDGYTCDSCKDQQHVNLGPWAFELGSQIQVQSVGAQLDGTCSYTVSLH